MVDRSRLVPAALVAAAVAIVAAVAWIALRPVPEPPTVMDALKWFARMMNARLEGGDDSRPRRELEAILPRLPQDSPVPALADFVAGRFEQAAARPVPENIAFPRALRGCALGEMGRREEAVAEIRAALKAYPSTWTYRSLFERLLRHYDPATSH